MRFGTGNLRIETAFATATVIATENCRCLVKTAVAETCCVCVVYGLRLRNERTTQQRRGRGRGQRCWRRRAKAEGIEGNQAGSG